MIEEIIFHPVYGNEKGLLGFISCKYYGLSLNSIAVYKADNFKGFILVYPKKILSNGKSLGLFYPVSVDLNNKIEEEVGIALDTYGVLESANGNK